MVLALEARLEGFDRGGFDDTLRAAVSARCETLGRRVVVEDVKGVAESIAPDGALVVRTDEGGRVAVRAGDVTLPAE